MKIILRVFCSLCFFVFCLNRVHAAPQASANELFLRLTIELRDGSRVVGKNLDEVFIFRSSLLGDLKLDVKDIRAIDCAATNSAKLTTAGGDTLTGWFADPELRVSTSFGKVDLAVDSIRRISVSVPGHPTQVREGLVALWSGEGDGTDSAGGNNGTLSGNATYADGKVGQAFSFDGVNSLVKIPQSPSLNLANQLTICFWMKADADNLMNSYQGLVTSDFYAVEISNGYGGRMGVNFAVSTSANQPGTTGNQPMDWNGARTRITSIGSFTHISDANGGGAQVTAGLWHHIAATYDGANLQLYVDGRLWGNPVRHTGAIVPMLPDSFVAIGSEDGRTTCPDCVANRYFKGSIDEVAVYNRALSASEIQSLCTEQNNGEPLPPPAPPPGGMPYNGIFRQGGLP